MGCGAPLASGLENDAGGRDAGAPDAGEADAGSTDAGDLGDDGGLSPGDDGGTDPQILPPGEFDAGPPIPPKPDAGPDTEPDAGTPPVPPTEGTEPDAGTAASYPLVFRAYFNVPSETAVRDRALETLVESLVDGTPSGSVIRVAMFSWTSPVVSDALVRARKRGAQVLVVVDDEADGTNVGSAPLATLKSAGLQGFVRCHGTGALATATSCVAARSGGIQHNKFFTFSTTVLNGQTLKRVVVVSSQNWTFTQNNLWNNAVLLAGDVALYNGYRLYFEDLAAQARTTDYYPTAHGYVKSPLTGTTAYFFPRADSQGGVAAEAATDTVAGRLAYFGPGTAGCFVHVAQNHLTDARSPVVQELKRIAGLGCEVKLVYGTIGAQSRAALKATPNVSLKRYDDNDLTNVDGRQVTVHSKYFVLHGTYNGVPNRTIVFTGSHNWSGASLRSNDENLLKVEDPGVSQAFEQNFAQLWSKAHCSRTPAADPCLD